MRRSVALALLPVVASAQEPLFAVKYEWSFSGKQYALASKPLEPVYKGITLDLVTGYETKDSMAVVWGPGLSYSWESPSGFFIVGGASLLIGAQRPDFALGAGFGFRF